MRFKFSFKPKSLYFSIKPLAHMANIYAYDVVTIAAGV